MKQEKTRSLKTPAKKKDNLYKSYKNFPLYIRESLRQQPANHNFLNLKNSSWESLSVEDFAEKIKSYSLGLKKLGLKRQAFMGLISPSVPNWVVIDQAIMSVGAATVPMFENISQKNLKYQVKETKLKYLFISGSVALETIIPILTTIKTVIYDDLEKSLFNKSLTKLQKEKFISLDELYAIGNKVVAVESKPKKGARKAKASNDSFTEMLNKVTPDDLATVVYTSGTTGDPKGVMLTHKNFINQVMGTLEHIYLNPLKDYSLSCLPLAHIFERSTIYFYIASGISIYFCPNLTKVGEVAREIKPTVMTTVPRILSKVYERINGSVKELKGPKKFLVKSAIKRAETKNPLAAKRVLDYLYMKLVYKKFQAVLGGKFRMIVSGGAALNPVIYRFFRNSGFFVLEGYGLTETSPVITANNESNNIPYTVGQPYASVEIKIQKDGEIWTKSDSVMKGYYKKPKATAEVLTKQGWFKTGDLGKLDSDGNLIIEGRKKDLFKLENGKYVSPLPLEQDLEKIAGVDNALIVGDGQKYVGALIFVDTEVAGSKEGAGAEELAKTVKKQIVLMNRKADNSWEKIVKHKLIWKKLSIEDGEITPKMNIKRNVLVKKYAKDISSFY